MAENSSRRANDNAGPALASKMPVSGIIKTRYGEPDDIGASSKGLVFPPVRELLSSLLWAESSVMPENSVTSGKSSLIEHKNKFHSLVAGLGKIDTFVGQRVDAGEPLGSLPSTRSVCTMNCDIKGIP